MKKEKEIWLDPDEIKQLLEGGLYWNDIEPKFSPENIQEIKRSLGKDDMMDAEKVEMESGQSDEEEDVRAILLGESFALQSDTIEVDKKNAQEAENVQPKAYDVEIIGGAAEENRVEDRRNDPVDSKEEMEVGFEEKNSFGDIKEIILEDGIEEEQTPFLGGLKLVLLLIVAAATTFGFWFYFINR